MIKTTTFGAGYAMVEVDGVEYKTSFELGKAIHAMIGQCKACGEPMNTIVRSHHHTEDGKDVTK
jgi:hypothetical protein